VSQGMLTSVLVKSMMGLLTQVGFPGLAIYSASKAALKSRSQTLAAELSLQGIRVNSIVPAPIGTPPWGTVARVRQFAPIFAPFRKAPPAPARV